MLSELFAPPREESLPKKLFFDEMVSFFVRAMRLVCLGRRLGELGLLGGVSSFEGVFKIFLKPEASRRLIPMAVDG